MKKILLLTAATFLSFFFTGYSQIKLSKQNDVDCNEIGNVKALATPMIEMQRCESDNMVTYSIHYKDIQYKQIEEWKSFYFVEEDDAFETLYKLIMDGFETVPKKDIVIDLPKGSVHLHFKKSLGLVSLQFIHFSPANVMGTSPAITKKQVQKLFGK